MIRVRKRKGYITDMSVADKYYLPEQALIIIHASNISNQKPPVMMVIKMWNTTIAPLVPLLLAIVDSP